MAKIPKTHIEGAVYYTTNRGDNNEVIFKDEQDYNTYLELLKKYKEQFGFKLFAFCLLPNHLHLLIELKEGLTISEIMHDLHTNYTKYFNAKNNRKGHLFRERAKMNVVEKDVYLLKVASYIHLNPLKLGLVQDLRNYKYSSYLYYIGGSSILKMDGDSVAMSELKGGDMENLGKDLSKKTILGSEEFVKKVETEVASNSERLAAGSSQAVQEAHRRFILIGSASVVLLVLFNTYLWSTTKKIKENLKKEIAHKEMEMSNKLNQEKEFIKKDLDEKYRADLVSYQAMSKRLEIEKNRVKELEEKTNKK